MRFALREFRLILSVLLFLIRKSLGSPISHRPMNVPPHSQMNLQEQKFPALVKQGYSFIIKNIDVLILHAIIRSRLGSNPVAALGAHQVIIFGVNKRNIQSLTRALHFWRRAGPIIAHYKFTQFWLEATNAPLHRREIAYNALHERYAEPSHDIILNLKGLFVKIGQVMSSRPDFIPHQYTDRFASVQDSLPAWPSHHIESIVRDSLRNEHGLELEDVFASIDELPLGSASIGQAHRAYLKAPYDKCVGNGSNVVAIKVMHVDAQSRFMLDFSLFRWVVRIALPGWKTLLQEFEQQVKTEFDYRNEANSLDIVRQNMKSSPYSKKICVPKPVKKLCGKNLLVMEMLPGKKLTDSIVDELGEALECDREMALKFLHDKRKELLGEKSIDSVGAMESRGGAFGMDDGVDNMKSSGRTSFFQRIKASSRLLSLYRKTNDDLDLLLNVHGHQIFANGCFNGDPHPGNILKMPDGRLGLIDYGQCKKLNDSDRIAIARIVSLLEKDPKHRDTTQVAQAMREFGFRTKNNRDDVLAKFAGLFFDSDLEGMRMGFTTPQLYLEHLTSLDPLDTVPDAAVFVSRASFLFRGMGAMLEGQLQTAKWWSHHAKAALKENRTETK